MVQPMLLIQTFFDMPNVCIIKKRNAKVVSAMGLRYRNTKSTNIILKKSKIMIIKIKYDIKKRIEKKLQLNKN